MGQESEKRNFLRRELSTLLSYLLIAAVAGGVTFAWLIGFSPHYTMSRYNWSEYSAEFRGWLFSFALLACARLVGLIVFRRFFSAGRSGYR